MTAAPQGASPKSTRYFYRDPLAAAWMAKHFGMKIESKGQGGMAAKVLFEAGDLQVVIGINAELVRYYVRPDSLHLLKPMEGDLVVSRFLFCDRNARTVNNALHVKLASESGDTTIIQRSGKAFHWPEQEAA